MYFTNFFLGPDDFFSLSEVVTLKTYDLVLHVSVELVDLPRGHEVVSPLLQWLLERLELPLHGDSLSIHLLRAFPLLAEGLWLFLQLLHLLLTHLHLALQDLQEDSLQVRRGEDAAAATDTSTPPPPQKQKICEWSLRQTVCFNRAESFLIFGSIVGTMLLYLHLFALMRKMK